VASLKTSGLLASRTPERGPNLQLHVIFTGLKETEASLDAAGRMARDLGGRLTLLVAEIVPYPLALDSPPVSVAFTERQLSQLAGRQEVETSVKLFLCRDWNQTVRRALLPNSIVIIGGPKRWWPTREQGLALLLRRDGHQVIMLDTTPLDTARQGVWKLGN